MMSFQVGGAVNIGIVGGARNQGRIVLSVDRVFKSTMYLHFVPVQKLDDTQQGFQ